MGIFDGWNDNGSANLLDWNDEGYRSYLLDHATRDGAGAPWSYDEWVRTGVGEFVPAGANLADYEIRHYKKDTTKTGGKAGFELLKDGNVVHTDQWNERGSGIPFSQMLGTAAALFGGSALAAGLMGAGGAAGAAGAGAGGAVGGAAGGAGALATEGLGAAALSGAGGAAAGGAGAGLGALGAAGSGAVTATLPTVVVSGTAAGGGLGGLGGLLGAAGTAGSLSQLPAAFESVDIPSYAPQQYPDIPQFNLPEIPGVPDFLASDAIGGGFLGSIKDGIGSVADLVGGGKNLAGIIGGIAGATQGGKTETSSRDPWSAAQPYLKNLLADADAMRAGLKEQPFTPQQTQQYGQAYAGLDQARGALPGLLNWGQQAMQRQPTTPSYQQLFGGGLLSPQQPTAQAGGPGGLIGDQDRMKALMAAGRGLIG